MISVTRGYPTRTRTFARFLGYFGPSEGNDLHVGEVYIFLTPSEFSLTREDMRIACQTLLVDWENAVVPTTSEISNKRQRTMAHGGCVGMPEPPIGENPQGERSNSFIYDGEGRSYFTRLKGDMAVREIELVVSFKILRRGRWLCAMGSDAILQAEEYKQTLVYQFRTRTSLRDPEYSGCAMLDSMLSVQLSTDEGKFKKLLKGLIGGCAEGNLRLQDFLPKRLKIPYEIHPCPRYNNPSDMCSYLDIHVQGDA